MQIEDFPKTIVIDTTNFCNLKCSMCARRFMTRQKNNMGFSLFRKIIAEIADVSPSTRVWMSFYGEPFLLKDKILWMIDYAKSKGLKKISINTNGTLLTPQISKGLIEPGLDEITIGLDAFSSDVYKKIRIGGNYERVVDSVNQLLELKKQMQSDKPVVNVQIIEMEENKNEINPFITYWTDRGSIVKVRPKISWIGAVKTKKNNIIQRYPCYWCMEIMPIFCDGSVGLCGADYNGTFIAGNINNESIREVWGGVLKKIRDANKDGDFKLLPPVCQTCTDWQDSQAKYY